MIPYDFDYIRPAAIQDALNTYQQREAEGSRVIYYAGGTEFISLSRLGQLQVDAVIDLKGIPECNVLENRNSMLAIGSAVTLSKLSDARLFPLLGEQVRGIASRLPRNRITLGGNLAGKTIYREAALPLLVCDAQAVVARKNGTETVPLASVFDGQLRLAAGEFIVQFLVAEQAAAWPFFSVKKTSISAVDYPLVSLASVWQDGKIRVAIGGVCGRPFRSAHVEEALNDPALKLEERIRQAVHNLPEPVVSDEFATGAYRKFLLEIALADACRAREGGMAP